VIGPGNPISNDVGVCAYKFWRLIYEYKDYKRKY
jgi:hypothetical protein